MQVLAGIDVGTTSVKVVLMSPDGTVRATGRVPTTWTSTALGFQTDADAITDSTRRALRTALDALPDARVAAVGVASMAESGVLVDRTGRQVAPVIAWHDSRDVSELALLQRDLTDFPARTGLPTWTQWSITKHRWLLEHVPTARTAVRRFNIAEWVIRSLGGNEACEQSLASRTGWLDLRTRTWWDESLAWSGASVALLPELVTAGTALGQVGEAAGLAELTGATLTVAGHDHQAAAVAAGAVRAGDELDSCGTAEAIVRTVEPGLSDAAVRQLTAAGVTVGWHALAGKWCLLAGTQGGLILQQVMSQLEVDWAGLAELDSLALQAESGAARVLVGDTVRVEGATDAGSIWRAATESVTADAARLSKVLSDAAGPRAELIVTGGWSHSTALMAAKAAALGPLRRSAAGETGARGAALLAGLAAGIYAGYDEFP